MKKLSLIAAAFSLVATACGPTQAPTHKKHEDPESRQVRDLQVGSDFLSTPHNWVEFNRLRVGSPQTKYLLYTAKADGNLAITKGAYAIGYACGKEMKSKTGDFRIETAFHLMGSSGKYDQKVEPLDTASRELMSWIPMKTGEKIRIEMTVTALNPCPSGNFFVDAVFNP